MLKSSFLSLDLIKQLPLIDGAIDLSKLIPLESGGTHEIYKTKHNAHFLVKVIRKSIGISQKALQSTLQDLTTKYANLYQHFGEDRCLLETRCIHKISHNGIDAKDAIISLVPFDTCFANNDKFGFNAQPVELMEPKLKKATQSYHAMNESLLGASPEPFNENDFLYFHDSFKNVFRLLKNEPSLKEVMQEFLTKFKHYYLNTDHLLDFMGLDNIVFYKIDNQWQYKIGSVIKHETGNRAKQVLQEIASDPTIVNQSFENWTFVFFVPSWLRLLNACAAKLGMTRIIENIILSPSDSTRLSKMHEMLLLSDRAINNAQDGDFKNALRYFTEYAAQEKIHDTRVRYMLSKLYLSYLENQTPMHTGDVTPFLNLIVDPKNEFPQEYWQEIQTIVLGLQSKLESFGPLESSIQEKINFTLGKVGYNKYPQNNRSLEKLVSMLETPSALVSETQESSNAITPLKHAQSVSETKIADNKQAYISYKL